MQDAFVFNQTPLFTVCILPAPKLSKLFRLWWQQK